MNFDKVYKELIPGGLAKGLTIKDISAEHKSSLKKIKDELKKGETVEREHTSEPAFAKEIARDHVTEDPAYYTKLKKVEKK